MPSAPNPTGRQLGERRPANRPPIGRMVWRALRLRCPWCGSRRTFIRRWLGRYERCRSCGIRWRREAGFELGPMTLNIIATFVVALVVMAACVLATLPDIPVLTLVLVLVGAACVLPLIFHPLTYTLWLAGDLAARPPEAAELADAASHADGPATPAG